MDNKSPVLTNEYYWSYVHKMFDPSTTIPHPETEFNAQRDSDHEYYSKLIEEKDKRIQVLEASLNDVKNQVEQVRKEIAQQIFNELDEVIQGCEEGYCRMLCIPEEKDYKTIKSKYGIK